MMSALQFSWFFFFFARGGFCSSKGVVGGRLSSAEKGEGGEREGSYNLQLDRLAFELHGSNFLRGERGHRRGGVAGGVKRGWASSDCRAESSDLGEGVDLTTHSCVVTAVWTQSERKRGFS